MNLKKLTLAFSDEQILEILLNSSNFKNLIELRIDLYDCDLNDDQLIIQLIESRGFLIKELRLKTEYHNSIIDSIFNYCLNLDVLSIHLLVSDEIEPQSSDNRELNQLDREHLSKIMSLKVSSFILLFCDSNQDMYDELNNLKSDLNTINDKVHIHKN